jgi:hypothetical protein
VFTPTLTGVAERSHPLNPNINLDTQILDVVNDAAIGGSLVSYLRTSSSNVYLLRTQ